MCTDVHCVILAAACASDLLVDLLEVSELSASLVVAASSLQHLCQPYGYHICTHAADGLQLVLRVNVVPHPSQICCTPPLLQHRPNILCLLQTLGFRPVVLDLRVKLT